MSLKARLRDFLARINISPKAAPIAILGIGVLAFGLLIPALGFYWDDWPIVLMGRIHGDLWQYYASDRPFMAWPDLAFLGLAGGNPLAWQAAALLVRMAAATAFWWCLTLLWPRAGRQVLGVALLFAIHPAFTQQPLAITYKSHFTTGLLYFISLGLMLLALRKPGWKIPLVISSLAIGAVHLLTMEYFWGLELLRPVLIWMVVSEKNASRLERLKKTFLSWLPWLALFIGVVTWRFYFLGLSDDRNTPTLLLALIQSPAAGLARLGLMVLRDSLFIGVSSWLTALQPATIAAAPPFLLISWALALGAAILVAAFLFSLTRPDPAADEQPDPLGKAGHRRWADRPAGGHDPGLGYRPGGLDRHLFGPLCDPGAGRGQPAGLRPAAGAGGPLVAAGGAALHPGWPGSGRSPANSQRIPLGMDLPAAVFLAALLAGTRLAARHGFVE